MCQGTSEFFHVGQNMAMGKSLRAHDSRRSFQDFIQGWYNEVKHFHTGGVGDFGNAENLGRTGHYSQVFKIPKQISRATENNFPIGCVGRDEGGGLRPHSLPKFEELSFVRSAFHLQLRHGRQHAGLRGLRRGTHGQRLSRRQRGWLMHLVVLKALFTGILERAGEGTFM